MSHVAVWGVWKGGGPGETYFHSKWRGRAKEGVNRVSKLKEHANWSGGRMGLKKWGGL